MKQFLAERRPEHLMLLLLGTVLVFGWLIFLLTLAHALIAPLVAIVFCIASLVFLFFLVRLALAGPLATRLVITGAFVLALLIGSITVPTIFSGRDQGSISEAAYRLAETGSLPAPESAAEPFFKLYGPGVALNFPGFSYTKDGELLTQFPLAYTSYLASFVALFGLSGFAFGNALLLFTFLLALYFLVTRVATPWYGAAAVLLAGFSFLPTWFAKLTLSENYALVLFTVLAGATLSFLVGREPRSYWIALLAGGLLVFTRIEGPVIFGLWALLMIGHRESRAFVRERLRTRVLWPALVLLVAGGYALLLNLPYYKVIGKAVVGKFAPGEESVGAAEAGGLISLWELFGAYGLAGIFLLGLGALGLFIYKKQYVLLLPAYLALPTFLYLLAPSITLDHPWMLRRYLFTLFPVLVTAVVLGLGFVLSRTRTLPLPLPTGRRLTAWLAILALLIAHSWPAWAQAIAFAEHRGLRKQATQLAERFGPRDLVLVDRMTTGNGFALITGPAQNHTGRDLVYFFNPADLDRLDLTGYDKIWLVVPESDAERYRAAWGERLVLRDAFTFRTTQWTAAPLATTRALPEKTTVVTPNLIFEIIP